MKSDLVLTKEILKLYDEEQNNQKDIISANFRELKDKELKKHLDNVIVNSELKDMDIYNTITLLKSFICENKLNLFEACKITEDICNEDLKKAIKETIIKHYS